MPDTKTRTRVHRRTGFYKGWGWPALSKKAHYFDTGSLTSLCGHWMFTGPRSHDDGASADDCKQCTRFAVKKGLITR